MTADEARQERPALGSLITGALFTPSHGYVPAHQLTHALARAAENAGARFRQATVQTIAPGRSALTVHTTDGDPTAATVVLAAGAWTNQIAIPAAAVPPLRPIRGQLLHLGWQAEPIDTILWGYECYIVPRLDGTLLVGATVEDVSSTSVQRRRAFAICSTRRAISCLRAGDRRFWGPCRSSAGHAGRSAGDRSGPSIAGARPRGRSLSQRRPARAAHRALIADWIVEKKNDPALQALRPGRVENVRST